MIPPMIKGLFTVSYHDGNICVGWGVIALVLLALVLAVLT